MRLAVTAMAGPGSLAASGVTELLREAGFGHVRRATETPFNLVLEARP